jgi:hypothetical protein
MFERFGPGVDHLLKEWLRAVFGKDGNDDVRRKLEPFLAEPRSCALLRLILENPGIGADAMARRSQLDEDAVHGYVDGFIASGLVVAEREGARTGFHIADVAKAAVVEHLPLNYQCPGMMRE